MTMFTMQPDGFHPVVYLFQEYYSRRMQQNYAGGGAAGEKRQNAAQKAYREGICTGFAAYANVLRAERYKELASGALGIPMAMEMDFTTFLGRMVGLYEDTVRDKKTDKAAEAEQAFVTTLIHHFTDIAQPEKVEQQLIEHRQAGILAGEIVAETPEEREWLAERLQEKRDELDRLETLEARSKAAPYVNTP